VNSLPTGGRADRPSHDKTTGMELIGMLLKAGANPDMQLKLFPPYRSLRDDRGADAMLTVGTTPLVRAAKAGDAAAIRLLLQYKANVELPTTNGITPLLAAVTSSSAVETRGRYKTEAGVLESVKVLVAGGADVNTRDRTGQTALHIAAASGWNSVITELAQSRVDLFAKDSRGRMAVELTRAEAGTSGRAAGSAGKPETEALLKRLMEAKTAGSSAR
jgi:hypothetical protein